MNPIVGEGIVNATLVFDVAVHLYLEGSGGSETTVTNWSRNPSDVVFEMSVYHSRDNGGDTHWVTHEYTWSGGNYVRVLPLANRISIFTAIGVGILVKEAVMIAILRGEPRLANTFWTGVTAPVRTFICTRATARQLFTRTISFGLIRADLLLRRRAFVSLVLMGFRGFFR